MAEPPLFFLDGFLEGFVIPFLKYFGGCWRSKTRFGCRLYKKLNPHGGMTFQACIFLFKSGLDAFVFRTCFFTLIFIRKGSQNVSLSGCIILQIGQPSVGGRFVEKQLPNSSPSVGDLPNSTKTRSGSLSGSEGFNLDGLGDQFVRHRGGCVCLESIGT